MRLIKKALVAGGHLGDDVARALLTETPEERHERMKRELWAEVDRALDPYRHDNDPED